MAVGQGSLISPLSYLSLGRETTFGTYDTCTAGLSFIRAPLKTLKENKILEQVETNRAYAKRISMGRVITGEVEFYVDPNNTAFAYILENAFGAAPSSATATGETAGGAAFTHTFAVGNIAEASYTSLCMNMRKGESSGGMVFEYSGCRVDEITFTAELDEALKCSISTIIKDSSQTSNDVASSATGLQTTCLSFVNGRVSVEASFASLTSTSFWHVQTVEFGITNSLKGDAESRRIGSDTIDVLPSGIATFPLSATLRFDTLTAYNAMLNETKLSVQLEFLGDTLGTSIIRQGLRVDYPEVYISDAGDPEIGGPDELITADVVFHVLRDDSSAAGYAVQALLTNKATSYA